MRVFTINPVGQVITETDALPTQLPVQGFVWIACARREFEVLQASIQATLLALHVVRQGRVVFGHAHGQRFDLRAGRAGHEGSGHRKGGQ